MAEVDGSIVIDTKVDDKGVKVGFRDLEASARRMAASVEGIGNKAKIALQKQVDAFSKLNLQYELQKKKVDELNRKKQEYANQKIPTDEYREIQEQIDRATAKLNALVSKQQKFLDMGGSTGSKAYKSMQYDIDDLTNTIRYAKGELEELKQSGQAFTLGSNTDAAKRDMEALSIEQKKLLELNNRLGTSYDSIKDKVESYRKKLTNVGSSTGKADRTTKQFGKSLRNTEKSAHGARAGIAKMLATSILFSMVFRAISAVTGGIAEGLANLTQYSSRVNARISMLMSSLLRLKNAFATAFAPILDIVAPILSGFIDMLSDAATYVSMFFAVLSGKGTYTKAADVQKDYAASLKDTAGAAQDAADSTKAARKETAKYLSGLDEIRRYDSGNDSGKDFSSGATKPGYKDPSPSEMFETVPVENSMKNFAESVKETFSKIFDPFKQAWETKGQQVIVSAKNALSDLGSLASSVGSSLLQVWSNGTGKTMLETLLQIESNVLDVIGNISLRLKEAWDKNAVGTTIIQNIANIFQRILEFVNRIWQATADWAASLDFYPLLESIKNLTEKIEPIVKGIGDDLSWIYDKIVLPLTKYLLEKGIPFLINKLSEFFGFLSSNKGTIEAIGAGLLAAFAAKKVISGITSIVGAVKNFMSLIKGAGGLLSLLTGSGGIVLAIGAVVAAGVLLYQNWDEICAAGKKIWSDLQKTLSRTWENIKTNASNMWKGITDFLEKTWNGLKSTASTVFSGIGKVAVGAWDGISKAVSNLCQMIQTNFPKAINAAMSIIKKPINGIISLINGLIKGIVTGINYVLSAFNHLRIDVPSWVPGIGGNKLGFNFGMLPVKQIPYLASGAVIPPNAPFMAVLGDQKHGTNIEAPLAVIEDAVERALSKHQNTGGNGNYTFIGQINRRVLFEEVISEAVIQQTVRGKNPFLLGG